MLLTATDETLELVTGSAATMEWFASYADHAIASKTFTPGSSQGSIAAATTTTLVAAPASGAQRQVKELFVRNAGSVPCAVTLQKDKAATNYRGTPDCTLQPGEALIYSEESGVTVYDASGRLKIAASYPNMLGTLMQSPIFASANLTTVRTVTSTSSYALYMGKAQKAFQSAYLRSRVTTAMATITWGEVAIAKGAPVLAGNPTLTTVGFADVSATFDSTGQKSTLINISSGQGMNEGDDVWLIVGNQATTAAQLRAQSIGDDLGCGYSCVATMRPSLNVGTGVAFTIDATTDTPFWMTLHVP